MVIRHKHTNISGVEPAAEPADPAETIDSLQAKMDELETAVSKGMKTGVPTDSLNEMRKEYNTVYERWWKLRFGS